MIFLSVEQICYINKLKVLKVLLVDNSISLFTRLNLLSTNISAWAFYLAVYLVEFPSVAKEYASHDVKCEGKTKGNRKLKLRWQFIEFASYSSYLPYLTKSVILKSK